MIRMIPVVNDSCFDLFHNSIEYLKVKRTRQLILFVEVVDYDLTELINHTIAVEDETLRVHVVTVRDDVFLDLFADLFEFFVHFKPG